MATQQKQDDFEVEATDHEIIIHTADRRYRVRGLEKNITAARLHVNLKVDRLDAVYVNSLDLYSDRCRRQFVKRASEELYVDEALIKCDLARIMRTLEALQVERARGTSNGAQPVVLTEAEQRAALALLEDKNLLERIAADFEACGLVGEPTGKLVCYLACVSRLLPQPLAVLIQSSSAAGKTTLMDAALRMMPPEQQIKLSAMTGQSLYYMGQTDLAHKILAVAEEEGVRQASYALKLLQSEGKLRLAAAERDGDSGRQRTQHYEVEGPVMMFLTTTAEEPDAELENRCLVLSVNETAEQTAAIHQRQRTAYAWEGAADGEAICRLHQNAQRLLKPLPVVIPWAGELTFRSDQTRYRRDHVKYLSLIATLALLHQFQRERMVRSQDGADQTCIVATRDDVSVANRLLAELSGTTLDGLLPQTRQLLALLDDYVNRQSGEQKTRRADFRFTQRALRETLGWSDRQVRRHLARLVELEYVVAFRTGVGNGREYALAYDGQGRDGKPFLLGLLDASKLKTERTGGPQRRNDHPPAAIRRAKGGRAAASKNGATRLRSKTSKQAAARTA